MLLSLFHGTVMYVINIIIDHPDIIRIQETDLEVAITLQEDEADRARAPWKCGVQRYVILIASAVIILLIAYFAYPFTTMVMVTGPSPMETPVTQIKPTPFIDETTLTEADIFSPDKSGRRIVELCIEKLRSPKLNMTDDNHFLKRVAYVMSEFGKNMKINGGIWQVSPTAFEDTKNIRAHKCLPEIYEQILEAYDIDWKNVRYKDLDKPFYSALAARLYISHYSEIPPAYLIENQAYYWKYKYMAGVGDLQFFIDKVYELEYPV